MGELLADKSELSEEDDAEATQIINDLGGWELFRIMARASAEKHKQWAGVPIPVPELPLVLEQKYPMQLDGMYVDDDDGISVAIPATQSLNDNLCKVRNQFWCHKYRRWVAIIEKPNGKIVFTLHVANPFAAKELSTLNATHAWTIEAETKAMSKLKELVSESAFKYYFLTGRFLESSKRSGVTYLFRRLRPTVAMAPAPDADDMRLLCGMCMHPVGYYDGSWGGCMVPTDDVIAHLLMMRADERHFWSKCNQHPPWSPEAGIY